MKKKNYPNESEIIFLRGDINYTEFHLLNGRMLVSSSTLLSHEKKLNDFIRVSRKHLVNPEYIKNIEKSNGTKSLLMHNGERITIARRKKYIL